MTFATVAAAAWNLPTGNIGVYTFSITGGSGTITANRLIHKYDTSGFSFSANFTKTFHQVTVEDFSAEDWSGSSDGESSYVMLFSNIATVLGLLLRVKKINASTYNLELATTDFLGADDQVDTGATTLTWGHANKYDLRIINDTVANTVTLEAVAAGGSWSGIEAEIATAISMGEVKLEPENQSDSTNEVGYGRTFICEYDSASERIGLPVATFRVPIGEGVLSEYDANSGPQHGRVDDWDTGVKGSDFDDKETMADDTSYKQSYTIGLSGSIEGYTVVNTASVGVYTWQRVTAASKEATQYALLVDDAGTPNELRLPSGGTGASINDKVIGGFTDTAPDGGAWTTAEFTGLELGVQTDNGGDGTQNAEVFALMLEIWDFPADPPPTTFVPTVTFY